MNDVDTMMKTGSNMASFGQDHSSALMRAGQIWMSGCQAIGQTVAANSQAHVEQMMSGLKAMSGARSLKDAMEMQKALMRSSVESMLASTSTITGATMTLVEESMAPITATMSITAERFTIGRV